MIESFDTVSNTILVRKSHESWINCVGIMAARGARARTLSSPVAMSSSLMSVIRLKILNRGQV